MYSAELIKEMEKLATPQAKAEYAATVDKYVYAKDLLVSYLPDEVWSRRIPESLAEYFEDMLEAE